jgi:porphyrinogen peroxidase
VTESQSPEALAGPPVAQPVLTPLTASAIIVVMTMDGGGESAVHDLLADLSGLARTVGFRSPDGGLAVVAGIGSVGWDRLFAGPRPAELHPFQPLDGGRHQAVVTPGDLLFHIRATTMDLCWELASLVVGRLAGAATVVDEVHGFSYFDERDLLGFVDGTENPTGRAAEVAVTIGSEDPAFAGGSYVIVQKYLHDMAAWDSLTVEEQERVIGRVKLSNVEMDDDVKPSNSHVALNTIFEAAGSQRQILRENMPFGSLGAGEFGTYFIGYAATPSVTELMLQHMFLGNPPGNYDRILDFSSAVTGTLSSCPPQTSSTTLPRCQQVERDTSDLGGQPLTDACRTPLTSSMIDGICSSRCSQRASKTGRRGLRNGVLEVSSSATAEQPPSRHPSDRRGMPSEL